ncbi:Protein of uncharacterised function (DUF692) [Pseudomonas aeruginosa]|nr:Protein of uncharacterised function (DUF692) [Pseudomonas aeruginosa]
MPSRRIAYLHMAGHDEQGASLKIDTHGAPVCDPVWELLAHAYACHGERPTLLERDFNLPPLSRAVCRNRSHPRAAAAQR